ncbi:phosphopantetheine-binding protein [Actinocorallia longicatena]|uniref:Carrier domain-containing protein n=1 Tax=Actinocorallia longicatena TaxID=111803 RepID=A0ABP6Q5P2_9ACTN
MPAPARSVARELIRQSLDLPSVVDRLDDDDDLAVGGIDSGEIVHIALRCEAVLGRALTGDELGRLTSVGSVADLLGEGP